MKKLTSRIFIIILGFLILTIGISYLIYYNVSRPQPNFENKISKNFYGNSLSQNISEGKKLYNIHCAACHMLDKNFVGPALHEIKSKAKSHYSNYLFDFITKEDSLDKLSDGFKKILNNNYEYEFNHNFKLTKLEFDYLMEYLN